MACPTIPCPHPRLWGTFPRVLGHYSRDQKLFPLPEAIRKMTGMPARVSASRDRGLVREGYYADLVLFDPAAIRDTATFAEPVSPAQASQRVWVNGALACTSKGSTNARSGRFLPRGANQQWTETTSSPCIRSIA